MKRLLIIFALAMAPMSCFAGIDGHKFALGVTGAVTVGLDEKGGFGVEGNYEMNINKVVLGAGAGADLRYSDVDSRVFVPVYLRAGYSFLDCFMVAANLGYRLNPANGMKMNVDGGKSKEPWHYNGFFIEPQAVYQTDFGLRFTLGTEFFTQKTRERVATGSIAQGNLSQSVKTVTHVFTAFTLGVAFVFGR